MKGVPVAFAGTNSCRVRIAIFRRTLVLCPRQRKRDAGGAPPRFLAAMQGAQWRAPSVRVSDATTPGASRRRLASAATFDAQGFECHGFPGRTIAGLERRFGQRAIGVKDRKIVGLGIRSPRPPTWGDFLVKPDEGKIPA
jgi:hypothetical protein